MHRLLPTVGMLAAMFFTSSAMADLAQSLPSCVGCHGADGATGGMPDAPIIAGIAVEVQEDALYAYKEGSRECPPPGVMCQIATSLSDDDIVGLAAHFAEMPYKPAEEAFDAELAATGEEIHENHCAACHGIHEPGDPQASIVHGQKMVYLRQAIQEYAAGKRDQLPPMESAIKALTPEQLEALVNYYASYRL
jgi:sulfide dehydrogenase cytochrome subunit